MAALIVVGIGMVDGVDVTVAPTVTPVVPELVPRLPPIDDSVKLAIDFVVRPGNMFVVGARVTAPSPIPSDPLGTIAAALA